MPDGGLVLARPLLADGQLGRVSSRALALPKVRWRVLEASGDADPKRAIERAAALVDEDPDRPWQPDRGEGAPAAPWSVLIDMAAVQRFSGLRFAGEGRPKKLRIGFGASPEAARAAAEERELPEKVWSIDLGRIVAARYLFVAIEDCSQSRFGELDLLVPEIAVTEKDGVLLPSCSLAGLEIRVSDDDTPTAKSRLAGDRLRPPKGKRLRARLFDRQGQAVGPVVVLSE